MRGDGVPACSSATVSSSKIPDAPQTLMPARCLRLAAATSRAVP